MQVKFVEQQVLRKMAKKGYVPPTDPDWTKQWFLVSIPPHAHTHTHTDSYITMFQSNSDTGVLQENGDSTRDLNVEPAWIQGYTGCNVVVAVVDDGEL